MEIERFFRSPETAPEVEPEKAYIGAGENDIRLTRDQFDLFKKGDLDDKKLRDLMKEMNILEDNGTIFVQIVDEDDNVIEKEVEMSTDRDEFGSIITKETPPSF